MTHYQIYNTDTKFCRFVVYFLQEREAQRKQKVHEKTTYTYRINARTKSMIRPAGDTDDDLSNENDSNDEEAMVLKDDPDFVLATTKGWCPND